MDAEKKMDLDRLSDQVVEELRLLLRIDAPASARLLKRHNHVYRIEAGREVLFLKTYTKHWYAGAVAETRSCVEHEYGAWTALAAHGLGVPAVVFASYDGDNPLGRPFIVTRRLRGTPLTRLLETAEKKTFRELLQTTGAYLAQMHSITFKYPGYIRSPRGPSEPPDENDWQHAIWSACRTKAWAFASLEQDRPRLSPELAQLLETIFATMDVVLAPEFEPPRFTHGDCHAHQFFLFDEGGAWQVSGVVDLEVASAGDCIHDFLKLGVELTSNLDPRTRWWEPLFAGYGTEPDFELFRLRLLGWSEINFTYHGAEKWLRTREEYVRRMLQARNWEQLFQI